MCIITYRRKTVVHSAVPVCAVALTKVFFSTCQTREPAEGKQYLAHTSSLALSEILTPPHSLA